jgi:phage recombination protein Bet
MKMNQTAMIERPTEKKSALSAMAGRFNVEPAKLLTTLKNTVFKGASDDDCMALVIVANEYNLNPLKKEIYAFPAKGGGITPVIGVDGWVSIMNSHPAFDGIEFKIENEEDGKPLACTATIHRKDRGRPVSVTEYFDECKRNTDPWNNMPRRMLRNRALAQCVRIAFTAGGILDEDEAEAILDPVRAAKPVRAEVTTSATTAPATTKRAAQAQSSKKDSLGAWMTEKQFTWSQIQPIIESEKVIENADSIGSFDDLTEDQAAIIFGTRTGIELVLGTGGAK